MCLAPPSSPLPLLPAPVKELKLTFSLAVTRDELATMNIELPWSLDHKEETGQCLRGLMATGLDKMPLYQ